MRFEQLTTLRNLARSLGITRLLSYPKLISRRRQEKYYADHRPGKAEISMLGTKVELNTGSAYEWMRAQAVKEDEHILLPLTQSILPGRDGWDIGASIGAYTTILARHCTDGGRVVAFEPEKESRKKLQANIATNHLQNVVIYDIALGHTATSIPLTLADQASAGTHRIQVDAPQGSGQVTEVAMIPMDELIQRDHLPIPCTMKIDVEGWEEKVLLGGQQTLKHPDCRAVMIEVHFSIYAEEHDNGRPQRIRQLLEQAGFQHFRWVDPSHLFATK